MLFLLGLFTAIFLYPFLHESGHSAAAIILGGQVVEFHLLPIPNVLCCFENVTKKDYLIIGLSGIAFPVLVSLMPYNKRNFCVWYVSRLVLAISVLASVISMAALILRKNGIAIQNEDVITTADNCPEYIVYVVVFLFSAALISILGIAKTKPITRILDYFGIKK